MNSYVIGAVLEVIVKDIQNDERLHNLHYIEKTTHFFPFFLEVLSVSFDTTFGNHEGLDHSSSFRDFSFTS